MKSYIKGYLVIIVLLLSIVMMVACKKKERIIELPNFIATPEFNGVNYSWEYGDDGTLGGYKEPIKVTWFINNTFSTWNGNGNSRISDVIKEKTGIDMEFIYPITDDNAKLSTMISSETLPDIVSIQSYYPELTQLANQGYMYPLNLVMDKWAPSFYSHLQNDVFDWFKQGNGYTYALTNYASSSKYMAYMPGGKLEPSGGLMIREDYLDEYLSSNEGKSNPSITTPEGFVAACKWIKTNKSYGNNDSVVLMEFDAIGSPSIAWLSQYFASPFEDKNGNYIERRGTEQYKETLLFLNELYREGLITQRNLSENQTQVNSHISNGIPFVTIVTPDTYSSAWTAAYDKGVKYVPLVLTNHNGDAPVLQDTSSMGYMGVMINSKAKRPDRIIKLLEFLYSEEGQRLLAFGVENESWYCKEQPTATSLGKIERTESYIIDYNNSDIAKYGFGGTMLSNTCYTIQIRTTSLFTEKQIYSANLKGSLSPYTCSYIAANLKLNTSSSYYNTYVSNAAAIDRTWKDNFPDIIAATSKETCLSKINSTLNTLKTYQTDKFKEYQNECYQNAKQTLKIEWGWPANNPQYIKPEILINGDPNYKAIK